jgi:hypothetical protein
MMLSAIAGVLLIIAAYFFVTLGFQEAYAKRDVKSFSYSIAIVVVCGAALIGALFLGPIIVVAGIIALGILLYNLSNMRA